MSMFCYQCQEAAGGKGCTVKGVCGKTADVANLQDLLIYVVKGISIYSTKAREIGVTNKKVDRYIVESLFTTITNANFNRKDLVERIKEGLALREKIKMQLEKAGGKINGASNEEITLFGKIKKILGIIPKEQGDNLHDAALWFGSNEAELKKKSEEVGVLNTENEDIRSLRELLTYGLKGMAAYMKHAYNLGFEDENLYGFMQRALAETLNDKLTVDELTALVLEAGKYGVDAMALLDKANTSTYGNPEITKVNIGVRNNPGILISGHDLKDMEELLKQTEGTGVDVYTHSEMLPANYYPAFKKYKHFVGNYG
ncbi:hydroxylamine reductase, partial [Clostridium thermopalmarium DSM 5974]